ncbi:MAG: type VI secretion system baseplate subunit TssG [Xanthomonadales bacterium]|nr:type VI secretion system baseplate subunit TssG [Xanthomonadales bacterium]
MASESGSETSVIKYLAEISEKPYRYGFYHTVRRINCFYKDKPITGQSFKPSDDPIRFSQEPYTSFATSTLDGLELDDNSKYPRLSQRFLGLFGPNGPLPLHMTEYARDRSRHHRDHALARFADMFHHRAVSLFYAAWAQSQPVVQFDRPGEDRFAMYVGSLFGLGLPSLRDVDSMHHISKLGFAGHLSSLPRHVSGLVSLVEGYFDVPTQIREYIAHWMHIPKTDLFQLGEDSTKGCLGQDTIIGERVWQRQDKFQVRLGPLSLDKYEAFLPAGKSFEALVSAVRNYVGMEFLWEVSLVLKKEEKPVTCLGKSGALGWTSWLETEGQDDHVEDLVLQVQNYIH